MAERFDEVGATTAWTYATIVTEAGRADRRATRGSSSARRCSCRPTGSPTLYYVFPLDQEEESLALISRALVIAGRLLLVRSRHRRAGHPAGRRPGAAGRRVAQRLAEGQLEERMPVARRGRPRPAGHELQRDGRQPPAADHPARGALPAAAAVHLRRLPRAAHPADDRADGRRRAARGARGTSTPHVARGRAAAGRARPLRGPAHRPAGDQPVRRRRRRARRRDATSATSRRVVEATEPLAERHGVRVVVDGPDHACSPRSTPVGSSGSCATWSATPSSTASRAGRPRRGPARRRRRGRGRRARLRRRASSPRRRHVFDRFWRADPSRVRTVGGTGLGLSISLEDARLHGGWLQVWGQPGRARSSGSPCR